MTDLVRTVADLRARLADATRPIGLVPTMGALHDGHRSLIAAARAECATVVVSIFVNPSQFGRADDLARYPRDEEGDAASARAAGADVLFVPEVEELYPAGFATWVDVEGLSEVLEGAARPEHFRGVATVCLKLFTVVAPQRAYFGQKDAQQAALVRRMIADLALPMELRVMPTVRDHDGVALSSRNAYLARDERARAAVLPSALRAGLRAHRAGQDPIEAAREVLDAAPGIEIDYVDIGPWQPPTLVVAVRIGTTRLIDNVPLTSESVEP
ncbi:MAG: pantoate--beta-alanine ligase [Chloroflexota bacterium]